MDHWKQVLSEVEGFLMLEMYEDADEVLETLPEEHQLDQQAVILRLDIAVGLKNWEKGAAIAREAVQRFPAESSFYLNGSWCIRRSESVVVAHAFLRRAKRRCPVLPALWHYNMACYEAQLGNLEQVGPLLDRAISLDKRYEVMGRNDPDLDPWREWIEE